MPKAGSAIVQTHADATLRTRQLLELRGLEPQIAALRTLRPSRRLAEIGFFVLLWIAGIALGLAGLDTTGSWHWPLRLPASLPPDRAQRVFLLSHDGHHRLLFRNARVNHAANVLLCMPLLHSPSAYRVLHELHHRFLGGPGDPDDFHNYTSDARLRWALHWVRLTIGTLVYMPLIPVVAIRRAGAGRSPAIAIEYAVDDRDLVAAFTFLPMQVLLQVWLIPGVLVGYISAVRAVAQHALTPGDDPLLASRSVASNAVVSFFLLNENYHLEHHLFPEIPSYNLPRLRLLLQSRLTHTVEARSYTRFLIRFVQRFLRADESPLGVAHGRCDANDADFRAAQRTHERPAAAAQALRQSRGHLRGMVCGVSICRDWCGGVRARRIGTRELVVYRDRSGTLRGIDRACAHLGADLAQATVVDKGLQCAFHRWCWGEDGSCTAGGGAAIGTRIGTYHAREKWGTVWVWAGKRPAYELPEPEIENRAHLVRLPPQRLACHGHVVLGNGLDLSHVVPVHGFNLEDDPAIDLEPPHRISVNIHARFHPTLMRRLLGLAGRPARWRFTNIGPSLAWVRVTSPTPFELLWTARPLKDGGCATQTFFFLPRWSALTRAVPMMIATTWADQACSTISISVRGSWPPMRYSRVMPISWRRCPNGRSVGVKDVRAARRDSAGLVLVESSRRLRAEQVRAVELDRRRLVMYRDHAGIAHVVDDRCPHLGSDLALGHVTDAGLRCEFHGWCWGADGKCVDAPGNDPPPSRRLRHYARSNDGVSCGRGSGASRPSRCRRCPRISAARSC